MSLRILLPALVLCSLTNPAANAQTNSSPAAGELLYLVNCIECHTAQVHWRDRRLASDWASLRSQVWRWQNNIGQSWSQEQIDAVTNYLNGRYYQFPGGRELGSR